MSIDEPNDSVRPEIEPDESYANDSTSRRAFLGGLAAGAVAAGVPGVIAANRSSTAEVVSERIVPTAVPTEAPLAPTSTPVPPSATPTPAPEAASPTPRALTSAERRQVVATEVRHRAAELAAAIGPVDHVANGEERADLQYAMSFTKGLPHDYDTGMIARTEDFETFVAAVNSGDPDDFIRTPLGPDDGFRTADADAPVRAWESQGIGMAFDLIGPDMQALTMPPAPAVGSEELTAEMAEIYVQALLRDQPLSTLRWDGGLSTKQERLLDALSEFDFFDDLDHRRSRIVNPQTLLRGRAPGDTVGPYLSQLLLAGTADADRGVTVAAGRIEYGAQTIRQRVRVAPPVDFMTTWDYWFDAQCGLRPPREQYYGFDRVITSGRDLATYVHYDALYQTYLNASLVMLAGGVPFDRGMPFTRSDDRDHQQGFVLFGAPHVLAMLAEVCMRALKTVMYQKFNVHRRARPEAIAGRLDRAETIGIAPIIECAEAIDGSQIGQDIRAMNRAATGIESLLLPMAYPEGSPMHPSYGAGHGTVAGACTTILKALFDHRHRLDLAGSPGRAFVANSDGSGLATVDVFDAQGRGAELTVEGEVNKLASNIAIGRDWAGVHYYSDYWESVLLGEQIAIQILREHMLTTSLDFSLTVPTFEGDVVRITT